MLPLLTDEALTAPVNLLDVDPSETLPAEDANDEVPETT